MSRTRSKKIDDAINEIKKASIFDGKDINDHPPVDETLDHGGRLHAALDLLHHARGDLNGEIDIGLILGLRGRAEGHIDQAIRFTENAIRSVGPSASVMAPAPMPEQHPAYLHALADLRAARWLIDHVPGDWARVVDEHNAVQKIDDAINEIKRASIDDGKDINDHTPVDETLDHGGRLHAALDLLNRSRGDLAQAENNGAMLGLRDRAWVHIDQAIRFTQNAIQSVGPGAAMAPAPMPLQHPAYIHAMSDLRAARWLIDHVPGDWKRAREETFAVQKIDDALNEIRRAAIDDGQDVNWHPAVQERNDHGGRLHDALDLLNRARGDLARAENDGAFRGLRDRAWVHIDEAIRNVQRAIRDNGW